MSCIKVFLLLVCLSVIVAVSATNANPSAGALSNRAPHDMMGNPASPDAAGVTLQLFMDQTCSVNISTQDTLVSPINTGCINSPDQTMSYNLICTVDNTGFTTFSYSYYTVPGCKGTSMTSINSSGKGKCLPTILISNGQPAPIPLYATVTCINQASDAANPNTENNGDIPSISNDVPAGGRFRLKNRSLGHNNVKQFNRNIMSKAKKFISTRR